MALLAFNLTGSPITLAASVTPTILPPSGSPPNPGPAFNVTSELRGLTGPQYTSLQAQAAGAILYVWTTLPEYPVGTLVVATGGGAFGAVTLTGTPTAGQVPTATGPHAATWQTPSGGGGGGGNVFVYKVGATPAGNVFADFPSAYAAAVASGLPATIAIDATGGPATVGSGGSGIGNYDLSKITLSGLGADDGTAFGVFPGVTFNQGIQRITGVLSVFTEFPTNSLPGTYTALITPTADLLLFIEERSFLGPDGAGTLFDLRAFNGDVTIWLADGSQISGSNPNDPMVDFGSGSANVNIHVGPRCFVDNNLGGTSGTLWIWPESTSATFQLQANSPFPGGYIIVLEGSNMSIPQWTGPSLPVTTSSFSIPIGQMFYNTSTGLPYWWNGTAWGSTAVPGVEVRTATPGSSIGSPVGSLSLSAQISVLINTTGGAAYWHLPDGTDGLVKEIVSGAPGLLSTNFIGVTSTNAYSNDLLDFNNFTSVRLVWNTAAGGWIAVSTCTNTNAAWD